mmetsp:Transcript_18406/g.26443  ORF Transcript_18406/g.26443 Transcript_18406/m.26443 type:complete len:211 (-) Transcript_18406:766-1398(-)
MKRALFVDKVLLTIFHCGNVCSFGIYFSGILDEVSSGSETDAVLFGFLGAECGFDSKICSNPAISNIFESDCFHCLHSIRHDIFVAIHEAAKFIFAGTSPKGAFAAAAEFFVLCYLFCVRVEGIAMIRRVSQYFLYAVSRFSLGSAFFFFLLCATGLILLLYVAAVGNWATFCTVVGGAMSCVSVSSSSCIMMASPVGFVFVCFPSVVVH